MWEPDSLRRHHRMLRSTSLIAIGSVMYTCKCMHAHDSIASGFDQAKCGDELPHAGSGKFGSRDRALALQIKPCTQGKPSGCKPLPRKILHVDYS